MMHMESNETRTVALVAKTKDHILLRWRHDLKVGDLVDARCISGWESIASWVS